MKKKTILKAIEGMEPLLDRETWTKENQSAMNDLHRELKKDHILTLDFWFSTKNYSQPMITYDWSYPTEGDCMLMQSSDYVFVKKILEDKKMNNRNKELLYQFCITYVREYENQKS